MSHINDQTVKIKAIPKQAIVSKARSTAVGAGSIAIAFVLLMWFTPPMPIAASGLFLAFGAWSTSRELVTEFLKFIPAAIKDIRVAIKGK